VNLITLDRAIFVKYSRQACCSSRAIARPVEHILKKVAEPSQGGGRGSRATFGESFFFFKALDEDSAASGIVYGCLRNLSR